GIRDATVTGVQTCALPIFAIGDVLRKAEREREATDAPETADEELRAASGLVALDALEEQRGAFLLEHAARDRAELPVPVHLGLRSEERRVGKGCRKRGAPR